MQYEKRRGNMSEEQKENIQAGNPLGEASVASLMVKFAVPSIIAMIVSALYNIVDQLFIGQAVGTLGNAATNVAFPLTTSCIALVKRNVVEGLMTCVPSVLVLSKITLPS